MPNNRIILGFKIFSVAKASLMQEHTVISVYMFFLCERSEIFLSVDVLKRLTTLEVKLLCNILLGLIRFSTSPISIHYFSITSLV